MDNYDKYSRFKKCRKRKRSSSSERDSIVSNSESNISNSSFASYISGTSVNFVTTENSDQNSISLSDSISDYASQSDSDSIVFQSEIEGSSAACTEYSKYVILTAAIVLYSIQYGISTNGVDGIISLFQVSSLNK